MSHFDHHILLLTCSNSGIDDFLLRIGVAGHNSIPHCSISCFAYQDIKNPHKLRQMGYAIDEPLKKETATRIR